MNGHDWKSCRRRKVSPGFESLPLRYIRLSVVLSVLLSGCAILPLESSQVPHPSSRSKPEISSDYREVVGVPLASGVKLATSRSKARWQVAQSLADVDDRPMRVLFGLIDVRRAP